MYKAKSDLTNKKIEVNVHISLIHEYVTMKRDTEICSDVSEYQTRLIDTANA